MQKCKQCNEPFSWKHILKSLLWTYKPIECNHCGTVHRITVSGRIVFVSLTLLPGMIFMNLLSPFPIGQFYLTLIVGVFIIFLGSLLVPFFVRFK